MHIDRRSKTGLAAKNLQEIGNGEPLLPHRYATFTRTLRKDVYSRLRWRIKGSA